MTTSLTSLLPESCFVPFTAYQVAAPQILWVNRAMKIDAVFLDEYAYFVPLKDDSIRSAKKSRRTFLADRYGGEGLGWNGGAGRCGNLGAVQIKGIGRTPLSGGLTDYFHSYGGAALSEGVLEAIWGEICHIALPFGGVRTYGLMSTGTTVPVKFPKTGQNPYTKRALIVREAPLRPAHYMRATFFQPSSIKYKKDSVQDAARTKAAIGSLWEALTALLPPPDSGDVKLDFGREGLRFYFDEMLKRIAAQIACARAKRIMHGSLTASNICVDGRWMDFGSISMVADYGRIIIPRGAPDFMHEERMIRGMLIDLQFYLHKYLPHSTGINLFDRGEAWSLLESHLNKRLRVEFIKLLGFTEKEIQQISDSTRTALYTAICQIRDAGNAEPFTILSKDNDYVPQMPKQTGKFHLNTIIQKLCLANDAHQADKNLRGALSEPRLRSDLIASFLMAKHEVLGRSTSGVVRVLHALRLNASFEEAFRTNLYPAIDNLIQSGGDVSLFIDQLVAKASFFLTDVSDAPLSLSQWCIEPLAIDADHFLLDGRRCDSDAFFSCLKPTFPLSSSIDQLRVLCSPSCK